MPRPWSAPWTGFDRWWISWPTRPWGSKRRPVGCSGGIRSRRPSRVMS
jgi:hypothetical protein